MNRRGFLKSILTLCAAPAILPAALTHGRIWKPTVKVVRLSSAFWFETFKDHAYFSEDYKRAMETILKRKPDWEPLPSFELTFENSGIIHLPLCAPPCLPLLTLP